MSRWPRTRPVQLTLSLPLRRAVDRLRETGRARISVYPAPEMAERSMPTAKPWCVADCSLDVPARRCDRVQCISAPDQVCGDRRGQRASRPVGVWSHDSRTAELRRSGFGADHVNALRAVQMPTLHQYDARAEPQDSTPCLLHVLQ